MKNIIIQFFGSLLLISSSTGILWEKNIARQLLPRAMGGFAWIRLLMDQPNKMSATDLIEKYHYPAELHEVQTDDGYFLTVHRIPAGRNNSHVSNKPVVLLFHSLLGSSDTWVLRGPKDLAFMLADNGYDVWITNCRGSFYSRNHVTLNPDTDKEFWNFSFHEMGKYDLPATVDYILNRTGQGSLFYIGHSMGNTVFFIFTSLRPEYNQKVKFMQAFGPPVLFTGKQSTTLNVLKDYTPTLMTLLEASNYYELLPLRKQNKDSNKVNSKIPILGKMSTAIIYSFVGFDIEQDNNTLLPAASSYTPAGTSIKLFRHFAQIIKTGRFQQFDYGVNTNKEIYNSETPIQYDLSKVTASVHLYYGDADYLVTRETTLALEKHLPNCTGTTRVPFHNFNHLDFLYASDTKSLLYDQVISMMSKYK